MFGHISEQSQEIKYGQERERRRGKKNTWAKLVKENVFIIIIIRGTLKYHNGNKR